MHIKVDRRVDLQAALVHPIPAEALDELLANVFLEVLPVGFLGTERVGEMRPASHRRVIGGAVDRPAVAHRLEHDIAPRDRAIEVDRRRVGRRRLDEAGQQRRFLDVEVARMCAEEAERCGFDAVEAVAEIDLVQIQLEDLILGELTFETPREDGLFHLPPKCLVRAEKTLSGQLLRERTAALRRAVRAQVRHGRGEDAHQVDAAVIVEALIFDRDDRVHEVRRDVGEWCLYAPLLKDREHRAIVLVVQRRRLRHRYHVAKL